MSPALIALGLVAAMAPALALATPPQPVPVMQRTDILIRERVIIRVPTREMRAPPVTRWKEKKWGKCLPVRAIAGAVMISSDTVDFVLSERTRVRAKLENSCPALDYYNGFYLRPDTADGLICVERDTIHARSGGECPIRRFKRLVPDR